MSSLSNGSLWVLVYLPVGLVLQVLGLPGMIYIFVFDGMFGSDLNFMLSERDPVSFLRYIWPIVALNTLIWIGPALIGGLGLFRMAASSLSRISLSEHAKRIETEKNNQLAEYEHQLAELEKAKRELEQLTKE
ncbi:hypothetical protein [uncultured Tateyamaria sp.]|uniref:hypothetical protein n=1 Tax=uncultured Tateyamaria sp. TaxID=455651 RepID=UPI002608BF9D|nr:hypothetical protein [uncultured Tateyamaria sp.]